MSNEPQGQGCQTYGHIGLIQKACSYVACLKIGLMVRKTIIEHLQCNNGIIELN